MTSGFNGAMSDAPVSLRTFSQGQADRSVALGAPCSDRTAVGCVAPRPSHPIQACPLLARRSPQASTGDQTGPRVRSRAPQEALRECFNAPMLCLRRARMCAGPSPPRRPWRSCGIIAWARRQDQKITIRAGMALDTEAQSAAHSYGCLVCARTVRATRPTPTRRPQTHACCSCVPARPAPFQTTLPSCRPRSLLPRYPEFTNIGECEHGCEWLCTAFSAPPFRID